MQNQTLKLILASTFLTWGSAANSMEELKDRASSSSVSPSVLREIPHDAVLVPMGPIARAKAASLETFYEKQKAAQEEDEIETVLALSLRDATEQEDEEAQFQRAIRLSLGGEASARSAAVPPPSYSSPLPIKEKKGVSPGITAVIPIAEEPIPENILALSLEAEQEAQRLRDLVKARERLNLNYALRDSLWDEQQDIHGDLLGLIRSSRSSNLESSSPSLPTSEERNNALGASTLMPIHSASLHIPPYISPPAAVLPPVQTLPTETISQQGSRPNDNNT